MFEKSNGKDSPKIEVNFILRDKNGNPTGKRKALVLTTAKIWLSSIISTKLTEPKAKRVTVGALPPKVKNKLSA